jgi:hypothetical protein
MYNSQTRNDKQAIEFWMEQITEIDKETTKKEEELKMEQAVRFGKLTTPQKITVHQSLQPAR